MLLRDRKRLNQQTGEMEGGTPTLSFNGGLPDVQINDPRSPLAEALAKVPAAAVKGARKMRATDPATQSASTGGSPPSADPYGLAPKELDLGLPAPAPTAKVSGGSPVGEEDELKKIMSFLTRAMV
jgi:hypothetical protein